MPFLKQVKTTGNVEGWLCRVQDMMKETLTKRLKDGNRDYTGGQGKAANPRNQWVKDHPGQIVTTIAMIQWCLQTEEAINTMQEDPMALGEWCEKQATQLNELT